MHNDDDVLWCSRLPKVTSIKIQMSAKVARYHMKHYSHLIQVKFCTEYKNWICMQRGRWKLENSWVEIFYLKMLHFGEHSTAAENFAMTNRVQTKVHLTWACWQKSRTQFAQLHEHEMWTIESGKVHKISSIDDCLIISVLTLLMMTNKLFNVVFDFVPIFAFVFDVRYLILN